MQRLGSDGRPVMPGPALPRHGRPSSDDCIVDDWGCAWQKRSGSVYFEIADPPLRNASIDDLDHYPWPDLTSPSRFAGLADRCRSIQESGFATVLLTGITLFEQAYLMRGLAECLMDLAGDQDFFLAMMSKLKGLAIPFLRELFLAGGRVRGCRDHR